MLHIEFRYFTSTTYDIFPVYDGRKLEMVLFDLLSLYFALFVIEIYSLLGVYVYVFNLMKISLFTKWQGHVLVLVIW